MTSPARRLADEPDRAQSCRVVVGMCRVMLDEIRLRAHARPLNSDDTT